MRKLLLLTFALCFVFAASAQERGRAEATFDDEHVAIDYGRPPLGGRDVETALPPGMLWRMGMNQATTIETTGALDFGLGLEIPAGTFSLYVRRIDEKSWSLVVNRQTGQWGTQYDPEQDVVVIPLTRAETQTTVERFTVTLERDESRGRLVLSWGHLLLSAEFEVEADERS